MNQKFTKKERIHHHEEIQAVRRCGKRQYSKPFVIMSSQNTLGFPRMAVALSRKCGPSVVRNRAKRYVREFFRKHKVELGAVDTFFYSSQNLTAYKKEDWKKILHFLGKRLIKSNS